MGGRGLLRGSFRVEVDEEGVKTGDWFASLLFGEAVPSFESLFFLEDLLESLSLPRERTLWLKRFIFEDNSFSSVGRLETPNSTLRLGSEARWWTQRFVLNDQGKQGWEYGTRAQL